MLKIKDDIELKELEKFYFAHHDKENAEICYYRLMPIIERSINILVEVYKDRKIDFQLPLGCTIKKQEICLEKYIQDLIKAGLVEKIDT